MKTRHSLSLRLLLALLPAFFPAAAWPFSLKELLVNRLDPAQQYRTVETPHFWIHYPEGFEEVAREVSVSAESAHEKITRALHAAPAGRTNIVLTDHSDESRVFSFTHPHSQIYFDFALPSREIVPEYSSWFDWILTHEYTHIVQLETRSGLYKLLVPLFGNWILPGQSEPPWFKEGLAVYMESTLTPRGRGGGSEYRMMMRAAVAENLLDDPHFVTKDTISNYGAKTWPWTYRPYLFGYYLARTLASLGPDALSRFVLKRGGSLPYSRKAAIRAAGFSSFDEWWRETLSSVKEESSREIAAIQRQPLTPIDYLTDTGFLYYGLTLAPNGKWLAVTRDAPAVGNAILQLNIHDGKVDPPRVLVSRTTGYQSSFSRSSRFLVFDQAFRSSRYYLTSDLYIYDLKMRRLVSASPHFRARDADVHPDGTHILFVANVRGKNRLFMTDTAWNNPVDMLGDVGYRRISGPRFSPDGRLIAVQVHNDGNGGEDLWLVADGKREILFSDGAQYRDVSWSPDGRYLLFASDRTRVFNAYAFDLSRRKLYRLSNVIGGIFSPVVDSEKKWVYAVSYHGRGYDVARFAWAPEQWIAANDKDPLPPPPDNAPPSKGAQPEKGSMPHPQKYKAYRYSLPQYLTPAFAVQGRDYRTGVKIGATDPLFSQSYEITSLYDSATDSAVGSFSYYNGRFPWAADFRFTLDSVLANGSSQVLRSRTGDLSANIPLSSEGSENYLRPGALFQSVRFDGTTTSYGAHLNFRRDTEFQEIGTSFPESGSYLDLGARQFFSGETNTSLIGTMRRHVEMPWPHHVLHASVEAARFVAGQKGSNSVFYTGGPTSFLEYPGGSASFNSGLSLLYGYGSTAFVAPGIAVGTLHYTFPLVDIQRGLVSPSLALGRLSLGVRFQAAKIENFSRSGVPLSGGIEIYQDLLFGYLFDMTARIGVYQGDRRFGGERQIIFSLAGTTF